MIDPTGWLERYGRAWEQADGAAAAQLFTPDAEYCWGPFEPPLRGQEAIRRRWDEATAEQSNLRFSAEPLGRDGDRVFAHWAVTEGTVPGECVELDGIFVLDFAADGRCRRLQEWWLTRSRD